MKRVLVIVTFLALGLGLGQVGAQLTYRYAYAQGIATAPLDAGPAPVTSDIATAQPPAPDAELHVVIADAPPVATPVAVDASFWSRVETLWRAGALAPAALLAAFGLLVLARGRVPWLQRGKAAVYSAIGVTALTTLLEPAARGATPSLAMIISAVSGAVLLAQNPVRPGKTAAGEVG